MFHGHDCMLRLTLDDFHQLCDLACGLRRAFCELPHLVGDHGKARSGLPGAGGLDRSVEGQQIRLRGDIPNGGYDL